MHAELVSKLASWLRCWRRPIAPGVAEILEHVSSLAFKNGNNDRHRYFLIVRQREIELLPASSFLQKPVRLLGLAASIVQGWPQRVYLPQKDISGIIGPSAKARKRLRRGGQAGRESALLFTPPKTGENRGRVLKLCVLGGNLAREIHMLETVERRHGMAPPVCAKSKTLNWYLTERIAFDPAVPAERHAAWYLDHFAIAYFSRWGVKSRRFSDYLRRKGTTLAAINEAMAKRGLRAAPFDAEEAVSVSIIHGIGIPYECLRENGGNTYLVDWENAKLDMIADDLYQLFPFYPEKTIAVFDALKGEKEMPAARQLLANTLIREVLEKRVALKFHPASGRRGDCAAALAALCEKNHPAEGIRH